MTLIKKPLESEPIAPRPPTNPNIYKVIIGALIIFAIIMEIRDCRNNSSDKTGINLINALQDTLVTLKNKDSSSRSIISILQLEKAKDFKEIKSSDTIIRELQAEVERNESKLKAGSSVTKIKTVTVFRESAPTVVVYYDTIKEANTDIYPTYKNEVKNKWIEYSATTNKDSTNFDLKVYDDLSLVIGYIKGKPYSDVTNYNPYSATKTLRTFQVSMPKPKRWGIGVSTGVTLGKKLSAKYYLGIGIQYSIFNF